MDSEVVITFPRDGRRKLVSLSFKNVSDQEMSLCLGPRVSGREILSRRPTEAGCCSSWDLKAACSSGRGGWWGRCLAPDLHQFGDGTGRRDAWAPAESTTLGLSTGYLLHLFFLFRFPFSLVHQAAGKHTASWVVQTPLPLQQLPLKSKKTRQMARGVGRSFCCPILICNCKTVSL